MTARRRGPRSPSLELAEAMREALESVGAVFGAQLAEIGRALASVRIDPAGADELDRLGAAIGAALLPAVAEAVNHSGRAAGTGGDRAAMLAGAVAAALALAVALRAAGGIGLHLRHG